MIFYFSSSLFERLFAGVLSDSEKILDSVRKALSSPDCPFLFHNNMASIMPGIEEGAFSWISFNYLKKLIGPKKAPTETDETFAVVDMGGASVQVSL